MWIAFKSADLPDAAGWGVAAGVLQLVPYLGMALFIIILSTRIGIIGTAWLQGRAAKMNSAAVFIGLVFWGALWGVWGLFWAPPWWCYLKFWPSIRVTLGVLQNSCTAETEISLNLCGKWQR